MNLRNFEFFKSRWIFFDFGEKTGKHETYFLKNSILWNLTVKS